MKERPIIFCAPMVRALLDGTKTQTRRVVGRGTSVLRVYPRWRLGDRLWVKETFGPRAGGVVFRADDGNDCPDGGRWRPSIFMPRWASRITLEITEVRVQRLQDISEEDAIAEGIRSTLFRPDDGFPLCTGYSPEPDDGKSILYPSAREAYASLWERINGPGSWSNLWVWALTFKRVAQ